MEYTKDQINKLEELLYERAVDDNDDISHHAITYINDLKKQLKLYSVSSSALIDKAETMQRENEYLVTEARGHWDKEYKKAIGIGIDRIIKLIKRHYC